MAHLSRHGKDSPERWRRSRRCQFSLRCCLSIVTIAALVVWCWDRWVLEPYRTEMRALALVAEVGGRASTIIDGPPWIRTVAGDTYFEAVERIVIIGPKVVDSHLASFRSLRRLKSLKIVESPVTDRGIGMLHGTSLTALTLNKVSITDHSIRRLPELSPEISYLDLTGTPITDNALKYLEQLPKLRTLMIGDTEVTDAGLHRLGRLKDLERLALTNCSITDEALMDLEGLQRLRYFDMSGTKVTAVGIARLELILNCHVDSRYSANSGEFILTRPLSLGTEFEESRFRRPFEMTIEFDPNP